MLTIHVNSREELVYPLYLSKRSPARGERNGTDSGIFFAKGPPAAISKDGLVVARGSHKDCRGLVQVFRPGEQKILNILQKRILFLKGNYLKLLFCAHN